MAAGIAAAPQFANTFTLHRIYVSAHFPGRCSGPAGRIPSEPPEPEGDSPACREMAVGGGCRRGLGCVRGVPWAGAGRGPCPGATRWQTAPLRSRSAPAASRPGRGLPNPASPLRPASSNRDRLFPCRHPLENRGAPEPEPKALSQCGSTAGTEAPTPSRDKILPFLSLPSRPRFWFPSVFLSFFYFPLSLSKGLPAFP